MDFRTRPQHEGGWRQWRIDTRVAEAARDAANFSAAPDRASLYVALAEARGRAERVGVVEVDAEQEWIDVLSQGKPGLRC